jgi:hypothetical protein
MEEENPEKTQRLTVWDRESILKKKSNIFSKRHLEITLCLKSKK